MYPVIWFGVAFFLDALKSLKIEESGNFGEATRSFYGFF